MDEGKEEDINEDDFIDEMPMRKLWGIVCGCLKQCIEAHGPITENYIGSAAKRIVHSIVGEQVLANIDPEQMRGIVGKRRRSILNNARKANRRQRKEHVKVMELRKKVEELQAEINSMSNFDNQF